MLRCPTCRELYERDEGMTLCPNDGSGLLPDGEELEDEDEAGDSFVGLTLEGGINLVGIAGEGAMGTVYEGWQTQMERRVAVKMLHGELAREPGFLERFMREARAVARLNHPNIVTVHSIGEVSGSPYLVMEFIEGDTVADEIQRAAIHPLRTIRITRQIASALADAHDAGIIHRDLKPSNVLLTQRRRASDFVKLLDFGVAKLVDADSTLTREGFVFGTPAYLSPEQANGVEIDARSDLYSLGVCMFEMLTQTLPFSGNQVQMLLAHARDPAPPVRQRAPGVPAELAALVDSMLRKDPNDRPSSAEVVADKLDHILGGDSPSPWASAALPSSDWTAVDLPAEGAHRSASEDMPTKALRSAPTTSRPRPLLLAFAGIMLLLAGAGTAMLTLRQYMPAYPVGSDFRPHVEVALPVTTDDLPSDALLKLDVPTEALMFSQDGYALRIGLPITIEAGVYYQLTVAVWEPTGEPLADQIFIVFEEPLGERPFTALPEAGKGHFVVRRRFDDVGNYVMKIYAPKLDEPIETHFEVHPTGTEEAPLD